MEKRLSILLFVIIALLALMGCGKYGDFSSRQEARDSNQPNHILVGTASWYGHPFHGRRTANGERYNMYGLTAASPSLPFGSWLRVTNLENEKQLFVRINDRGPYVGNRILDLSYAAARELGVVKKGTSQVKIEVFKTQTQNPS